MKLKGGEYVALEKMNTAWSQLLPSSRRRRLSRSPSHSCTRQAYNNSPFVEVEAGGVCCFADHTLDRSVPLAHATEVG